jgi:8-oxo-dGTP pyrophosphatase MutT (NUDIX family)|tara:strand:+ start:3179 stop:3625 length:447 start_codon:yes stop_codon:yes gene_type:complete
MTPARSEFSSVDIEREAGIVICLNDKERFLILRRSPIDDRGGQWTIPGGHIDDDDRSLRHGAARELKEETNLTCSEEDLVYLGEPKPQKHYFLARKWSGEVNAAIPNPESGEIEHDAFRWATVSEIKEIENSEIPIYLLEKALEISKK